jgi:large subunit ribosomal protein L21
MYAIVEIAGQQVRVEKDQEIIVHRLSAEEGNKVEFNEVLMVDNDGKLSVGAPYVEGARVTATVIGHLKGDKVTVFKKKRRKGYQKSNGHRQYLTRIQIEKIQGKTGRAKKAEEPAPARVEEAVQE